MPVVAFEAGIDMRARAHQSGNNRQDANTKMLDFGVQALGEAYGSKLRSTVGKQVGHTDLAANGSDVDDATLPVLDHGREHGQRGIDHPPEDNVHGFMKVV